MIIEYECQQIVTMQHQSFPLTRYVEFRNHPNPMQTSKLDHVFDVLLRVDLVLRIGALTWVREENRAGLTPRIGHLPTKLCQSESVGFQNPTT